MAQDTLIDPLETSVNAGHEMAEAKQPFGQRLHADLFSVSLLLLREKHVILRFMLGALILTAGIVYLIMKPEYTGQAAFFPPQTPPGSAMSQIAGQLGALGMGGALGGLRSTGDIYLGVIESRTIADDLIGRFDLQNVYKTKKISDTEKKLKRNSTFIAAKNNLITISVIDHDPKRAADLANGYLDALRKQNGRLALTESAQRRLFFEQQLEREKNALADAEVELKKTQEQTGLIVPFGQAQAEIETTTQIRAEIASRQVELASLRQGATNENPEVIRLQSQITGLQQELQKLQNDTSKRQPGNIQLPTAKVPELSLAYVRKQREVKYHEVLFELLAKQYESAKLDESKDAPVLQIIDYAVVPDKKSGPSRVLLLAAGTFFGFLLGAFWVILKRFIDACKQDPDKANKLLVLQQALRW